jgi:uncharacterized metal-binding protein YceD (DUF177 family)
MSTDERIWSVPVRVEDVHEGGRHFDLRADEATRASVAKAANLPGVSRLEAAFDVTRHGADDLRVTGQVSATITQICVVTLEPMTSEIDERVDLVFSPSVEPREPDLDEEDLAVALDEPEPLVNGTVDLGALAVEFLLLGIDPYPRKPDAVFEAPVAEDARAHPFAALAALKKGSGDTEK